MDLTFSQIEVELEQLIDLQERVTEDGDVAAIEAVNNRIKEYVQEEVAKVDGIRWYLRLCKTMAESRREEAKVQARGARVWESREERMKDVCIMVLQAAGKTKVEGATGSLSVRGNGGPAPLNIHVPSLIPDHLRKVTISLTVQAWKELYAAAKKGGLSLTMIESLDWAIAMDPPVPDEKAIRIALEAGQLVAGAKLDLRGYQLRVT